MSNYFPGVYTGNYTGNLTLWTNSTTATSSWSTHIEDHLTRPKPPPKTEIEQMNADIETYCALGRAA